MRLSVPRICEVDFYPRPPRGGRRFQCRSDCGICTFLSTPSARRATNAAPTEPTTRVNFYPRPPRGGRRQRHRPQDQGWQISIHALREEGDASDTGRKTKDGKFLSTPSARRATSRQAADLPAAQISIHALHEEGDSSARTPPPTAWNFYPRPPRGGRLRRLGLLVGDGGISIHALREEGDSKNRDKISIFKQIIQHSARI